MAKRPRAATKPDELAELLKPFVTAKKWLCYPVAMDAPVNRLAICSHAAMIRSVDEGLGHNLSIIPKTVDAAFTLLAAELHHDLGLKPEHCADWASTMSKRLRKLLRDVAQARTKKSSWATRIFQEAEAEEARDAEDEEGEEEEPASEEEGEEEEPADDEEDQHHDDKEGEEEAPVLKKPASAMPAHAPSSAGSGDVWMYGFSWEHSEAWRCLASQLNAKTPNRDFTKDIFTEAASVDAPMLARWSDGHEHEVPGLVKSQWDELLAARLGNSRKNNKRIFEALRKTSGTKVFVSYRSERPGSEMYGLYEDGKQITMVLLSKFGGKNLDDGPSESSTELAMNLALKLAKEFVDENIDKAELVRRRNLAFPSIMKKPAAAKASAKLDAEPDKVENTKAKVRRTRKQPENVQADLNTKAEPAAKSPEEDTATAPEHGSRKSRVSARRPAAAAKSLPSVSRLHDLQEAPPEGLFSDIESSPRTPT